jgi:ribose transport system substrate-binding protein
LTISFRQSRATGRRGWRAIVVGVVLALTANLAACGNTTVGTTSKSDAAHPPSVALSNSYDGNSWRQVMVANFTTEARLAQRHHLISKFEIVNADNSSTDQIGQIEGMILQGYKVIVVDAASTTALNGVIGKACQFGITVVVFDSLVTAPCAYKVATNYVIAGKVEANFVAQTLHDRANLLEVRGIAGTSVDEDINQGIHSVVNAHRDLKIVGQVYGQWTESVAQTAVEGILPSTPAVQAVVDQGGDGAGAAQAFTALHRQVPLVVMGNRGQELLLWKTLLQRRPGYRTLSISSMPGMSTIAMWVGQQVATGHHIPMTVYAPLLEISQAHLAAWLKVTPASGVATELFNLPASLTIVRDSQDGHPDDVVASLPSSS